MTDETDIARQVAKSGDRIAQKLHATSEMLTTIQQGLDAQAPFLAASKLIAEAARQMLGDALDLAALGAADGGRPQ